MAEPDGDPPPPQIPPAVSSVPQVPPAMLPEAVAAAPRTDPPNLYNPRNPPPAPQNVPGTNDLLALLQAVAASQTPPPQRRKTLPKQEKKFHRRELEVPALEAGGSPSADEAASGLKTPIHVDSAPPPGEAPVVRKRRLKPAPLPGGRWLKGAGRLLVLAALAAGIFMAGRMTARNRQPIVVSPVPRATADRIDPDPEVSNLINQAMASESRSDFAKATGFLEEVMRRKSRVAGVDYHLALLAYESGDMARVLPLLNRSIEKGEEMAACYNLRGTLYSRMSSADQGLADLETAARLDPYNARYFFFVGEVLRRAGKPTAALQWLRQASERVREPTMQSLYDLKVRLAQIELGQGDDFAGQLATELKRTPPSVDWLFTAAAVALHERRFDDASKYFDQVLAMADQITMNSRLTDFFFCNYAHEKRVAWYFAPIVMTNSPSPTPTSPPATPAIPTLP